MFIGATGASQRGKEGGNKQVTAEASSPQLGYYTTLK